MDGTKLSFKTFSNSEKSINREAGKVFFHAIYVQRQTNPYLEVGKIFPWLQQKLLFRLRQNAQFFLSNAQKADYKWILFMEHFGCKAREGQFCIL